MTRLKTVGTASVIAGTLALLALAVVLTRDSVHQQLADWTGEEDFEYHLKGLGYLALAAAGLLAALACSASLFWPALAAAAPVGLVALAFDAFGRSREVVAETAGAMALAGAATAIALAGGFPAPLAWAAGGLLALRAIPAVLYVRARLRLDRGLGAGPGVARLAHAGALW